MDKEERLKLAIEVFNKGQFQSKLHLQRHLMLFQELSCIA